MGELLSQEEIDELLKKLENVDTLKSIIQLKPREIENIKDYIDRDDKRHQFSLINQVYIRPLEKVLNDFMSKSGGKIYRCDLSDMSIIERVISLRRDLLNFGYRQEDISSLVPRTVEEVNYLTEAIENGFNDENILTNDNRVQSAKDYLREKKEVRGYRH